MGTGVLAGVTFYAYVGAGENLDISILKSANVGGPGDGAMTLTARGPDDEVFSCALTGDEPGGTGCTFSNLTSPVAGAWQIELADMSIEFSDRFNWTINVQNVASVNQPGRVWTEEYIMSQPSGLENAVDFSFWYQSGEGFLYQANYEGYNGINSRFSSNATGNALLNTCVPAYESFDQLGDYSDTDRFYSSSTECGDRYKIFFESPDPALPPTALLPDGSSTWVQPDSPQLPELTNLAFAQDLSSVTRVGQFIFSSESFTGVAALLIDTNDNGDYTDPEDRTIAVAITEDGPQTVDFDGLDGLGNPIPSSAPMQARVQITQAGEIHFSLSDAETRGGLEVLKLNGPDPDISTLYWNDSTLRTEDRLCATPQLDGTAGVDSTGGVHGWTCHLSTNNGTTGSWGDARYIDDWTYHAIEESVEAQIDPAPPSPLVFGKQVVSGPTPVVDAPDTYDVVYQVTVRNPGVVESNYGLLDEFRFGSMVTVVTPPAPAVAAAAGTPAPNASWNGDSVTEIQPAGTVISSGVTHTYMVTVRVTFPPITEVNTANDCQLDAGEDGTGLLNVATLTQPGAEDRDAVACRSTGFPNISKSGVVVDGPNEGSTTTAEANDVIEWKVQYQNVPDSEGEGVDLTDAIGPGQTYVPLSLDTPDEQWTPTYSTTAGSLDPLDFAPATPEPAGVDGVGMTHPTNGLPTAVGGTADFPPPPVQSSSQAGTGGDGFEPIPFKTNVYNIFHHQTGRVYCTVKQTGAICPGYPADGYVMTPLAAPGVPYPTSAAVAAGTYTFIAGDQPYIYPDYDADRLWIGGQLNLADGSVQGASTGRIGYACIDVSDAVPTSCDLPSGNGWVEISASAVPPYNAAPGNYFTDYRDPTMMSAVAWPEGGELLGLQYLNATQTAVSCVDVASAALCPSLTITWPEANRLAANPGLVTGQGVYASQLGTTSEFVVTWIGASGLFYDVCYDAATNTLCAGWAVPLPRSVPAGFTPATATASKAFTTYSPGMAVTGYCHVWAQAGLAPVTTCYDTDGVLQANPAGWAGIFPAGPSWGFGVYWFQPSAGETVGNRTYWSMTDSTQDRMGCYDWALQALCGAPYPFDLGPGVNAWPYELNADDVIPTCMWELGHFGNLYSFDVNTGGPCTSTIGRLEVTPANYYCESSTPTINGWDRIVVHNIAGAEFSTATLTLRDADGNIVPGWENRVVTPDLFDGVIDVSSIPYDAAGPTRTLEVELRFDGILPTTFQPPHPTPSITMSWMGDPIEMCFRTLVGSVCNLTDIDNAAQMVFDPEGSVQNRTSGATASLDYIATNADCFEIAKTVTGRTYLGDGNWEITYDVDVTSLTPAQGRYNVDDELRFGAGITVLGAPDQPVVTNEIPGGIATEPSWTGASPTIRMATDASILPLASHTYGATVRAHVPAEVAASLAANCTPDAGENGNTGFSNTATLTGDGGGEPKTAEDCINPLVPTIDHTKVAQSVVFDEAAGEYVVTYLLRASATGEGLGMYDITDTLAYPAIAQINSTAVSAIAPAPADAVVGSWTGAAPNTLAVDDAVIDSGDVQDFQTTVRTSMTAPLPEADGECLPGEDFHNDSTLTPLVGDSVEGEACIEVDPPVIDHTKTLTSLTPNGDGTYTVVYSVVVTNTSEGAGFYDLGDTLRYGTGVEIVGTPTAVASAGVNLLGGWNGTTVTALVDDQPIDPSGVHTYTLTVVVRPNPTTTVGAATNCALDAGEGGTGVRNESTLTYSGGTQTRDTCGELPHFVIDKSITSGPTDLGNGQYQLGYTVTVTNDGAGSGAYNLADHLTYGANVTIVSANVINTGPGGIPTNAGWNGTGDTTVATGVTLAAAGVHTYGVMVTFTVPAGSGGSSNDCTLDPGESGTGLLNTATVNNNGTTNQETACAQVASPVPPLPTTVPPTTPDPGELPATGGNSMPIAQIALLLLAVGALVLLASRRTLGRRRHA